MEDWSIEKNNGEFRAVKTKDQQILKQLGWSQEEVRTDPIKNKIYMCLLRNDSRENVILLLSQVVENNLKLQQYLRDAIDNSKIRYFC